MLGGERPFATLPAGYSVSETSVVRSDPLVPRLDRAVRFTLAGPDFANAVTFYLHADEAAARASYSDITALRRVRPDPVEGLDFPAKAIAYASPDRQQGSTSIYLLAGQVLIEATSTLAVTTPGGQFAHAYELAAAARDHLLAVTR